jgi:hypothetical protein|tara:strand:- start:1428 stop:1586 length:159 start_codon:yes stop_codon:yes gene_type:complete
MAEWKNMRETDNKRSRTAVRCRYVKHKKKQDKKRKQRALREGKWQTDDQQYD